MWPTPCGKKRVIAPLSSSVSGSPRRTPSSTRPSADDQRRGPVDVAPLDAGRARLDGRLARAAHGLPDDPLLAPRARRRSGTCASRRSRSRGTRRPRPPAAARPPSARATWGRSAGRRCGRPAATIDSYARESPPERRNVASIATCSSRSVTARLDQAHQLGEARPGGLLGDAHALQLDVVLRPPHADQLVAQLLVGVGRGAQPAHGAPAQPVLQLVDAAACPPARPRGRPRAPSRGAPRP